MTNFYEDWLAVGTEMRERLARSPAVARDRDIPWVTTRQDARVKLMIGAELGFATMGGNVLKAEIPAGWHTGRHAHGEESMHILNGEGFSIIDGRRFDWHAGTTIQIPYRAMHQHFNTGTETVQYISGMIFGLERFVGLAEIIQEEDHGPNDPAVLASHPAQESEYHPNGDRAILHLEDAPNDPSSEQYNVAASQNQHVNNRYLSVPANGFKAASVNITHRWVEPPYHHSGRHRHLEAVVYTIDGVGYTNSGGQRYDWESGDALHVPPAMLDHEHFNDSPGTVTQLRIQFAMRYWFTDIWPDGYTAVRSVDETGAPVVAGAIAKQG